jgi:carbon-monoxide dehydrogenase medium subunit
MFTYHRPASLAEACRLLEDLGDDALLLAGGTDVVPDLRRQARNPRHIVSLRDLADLDGIHLEGGHLRIGALSTPARIAESSLVRSARPDLLDAVGVFATPQVRNRATIGGNLCTAAACGDLTPLLLALGAVAVVAATKGRREIPMDGFFRGVRSTTMLPGEILVEILVPARKPGEGARYEAFGQRAAAFITVAGVAASVRLEGEICSHARVVLSAVAPTPLLVTAASERLTGRPLDEAAMAEAADLARKAARPISDVRGSAQHRRDLVETLTVRALRAARKRAHENAA